jgi:hypothetical protein
LILAGGTVRGSRGPGGCEAATAVAGCVEDLKLARRLKWRLCPEKFRRQHEERDEERD